MLGLSWCCSHHIIFGSFLIVYFHETAMQIETEMSTRPHFPDFCPQIQLCFFFRTARKTTQAIRQGWTKVKGAAGEGVVSGMGVHRGGGGGGGGGGAGVTRCANGIRVPIEAMNK